LGSCPSQQIISLTKHGGKKKVDVTSKVQTREENERQQMRQRSRRKGTGRLRGKAGVGDRLNRVRNETLKRGRQKSIQGPVSMCGVLFTEEDDNPGTFGHVATGREGIRCA